MRNNRYHWRKMVTGCLAACLGMAVVRADDPRVEVAVEPAECRAGTELTFKVKAEIPADRVLTMFHVYAYLPEIPAGVEKLPSVALHPNPDPKWSAVWFTVKPYWLPAADWSKPNHEFKLKTVGWPVGDYRLLFKVLLRDKARPEVKTDRYLVVPVMVTVLPEEETARK